MAVPASVPADGSVKAVWVPTLTTPTAPKLTELSAGTAIDLSCYLTSDGLTTGTDEQTITDDRLCSRQTFMRPGRFSDTLSLRYVYKPQTAATTDNAAFFTLKYKTEGFVVLRWGKDYELAFAVADIVDVYPVQCGVQMKQTPEANSVLKVGQTMHVTGSVERDKAVVA